MQTITLTITEDGNQLFLHGAEIFGTSDDIVRRASHVYPECFWLRLAFRAIRFCVSDTSGPAKWTRIWRCLWRVDTSPVGGPVFETRFINRQAAIDAEVQFLNNHFLGGKNE
jgi:hypothetical protein